MNTYQNIELRTKTGAAFLAKVVRDNKKHGDTWRMRADAPDWAITFERVIPGETGEPDECVYVKTDETIYTKFKTGTVRAFPDSEPVTISQPRYCYLNGETILAAKLLREGFRFELIASAGSTNSSRLGLSFYYLHARNPELSCYGMTVGGETVAQAGRVLSRGVVSL